MTVAQVKQLALLEAENVRLRKAFRLLARRVPPYMRKQAERIAEGRRKHILETA